MYFIKEKIMTHQRLLPLHYNNPYEGELILGDCNGEAFAWLEAFPKWSHPFFYVWGEKKSGKSTLARLYAQKLNALLLLPHTMPPLKDIPEGQGIVMDDAEEMDEEVLFHLYNRVKNSGHHLLMEKITPLVIFASCAPADFPAMKEDVHSRLRSFSSIELGEPDEETCRMLVLKQLQGYGLTLPMGHIDTFLLHAPRTYAAMDAFSTFAHKHRLTFKKSLHRGDIVEFAGGM